MAKSEESEAKKENLPAVIAPSIVDVIAGGHSAAQDEVSAAFGVAVADQQRNEAPGMTLIKLDHKTGKFLINGEPVDSVRGYPIHWFQARAYWSKAFKAGDSSPPDCMSPDGVKPVGDDVQCDSCFNCPMAQFGSARDDKGQACRVTTFMFLLNPEFGAQPIAALLAPPSSIKSIVGTPRNPGYLARAKQFKNAKTGKPAGFYELVFTEFTLERGGDVHCVIKPEPMMVAPSVEEARAIAAVRGQALQAMELLRGRVGEFSDRDTSESSTVNDVDA